MDVSCLLQSWLVVDCFLSLGNLRAIRLCRLFLVHEHSVGQPSVSHPFDKRLQSVHRVYFAVAFVQPEHELVYVPCPTSDLSRS